MNNEYTEYISQNLGQYIDYKEYLSDNLDKSIDYSKYISDNLDKSISYAEYIFEHMKPIDQKLQERRLKIEKIKSRL